MKRFVMVGLIALLAGYGVVFAADESTEGDEYMNEEVRRALDEVIRQAQKDLKTSEGSMMELEKDMEDMKAEILRSLEEIQLKTSKDFKGTINGSIVEMKGFEKKNPLVALGLSFPIIGAGQVYNGDYLKGGIQFTSALTGLVLLLNATGDNFDSEEGNVDADDDDWKSVPGYTLFIGASIWSLIDAPMSARAFNKKRQFVLKKASLEINPITAYNRVGTKLTVRF